MAIISGNTTEDCRIIVIDETTQQMDNRKTSC